MVASIANWTSFLQSELARGRSSNAKGPADEPIFRVLLALRGTTAMPLTEVVSATQLQPDVALSAVETLRQRQQVEVFEQGEGNSVRFLRLTPGGYAALAILPD